MIQFTIQTSDAATPILNDLQSKLSDRTGLNKSIAGVAEALTRRHIIETAAPSRHNTASRLGATPTGYLTRRGNAIESSATSDAAIVTLAGATEIFARVSGDVDVHPVGSKYLTIPANAAAFGHRAGEFPFLRFMQFPSGVKALVRVKESLKPRKPRDPSKPGPKRKPAPPSHRKPGVTPDVYYWLRESVTLPQDRELLPSDEQYTQAAELGARDYLKLEA